MTITIQLPDELAQRLQTEASRQKITVEELANKILEVSISNQPDDGWGQRNQRRLELIRKSTRGELTQQEQRELNELQTQLDESFKKFDNGLLQQLDEMKKAITDELNEESHE